MTIDDFISSRLSEEERKELVIHAIRRLLIQSTKKSALLRKAPSPEFTPDELDAEEYRDIPNSTPKAKISNLGQLRRANKSGEFVDAEPYITGKKGYRQVAIADGKRKYVHQLVAEVFDLKRNTNHQCVVNHKNLNPGDNRLSNLEWATQIENLGDAAVNDLFGYGDNKKDWSENLKSALKKLHDHAETLADPNA